jgi:N-acetylmuramoyl-L-alanine amidase
MKRMVRARDAAAASADSYKSKHLDAFMGSRKDATGTNIYKHISGQKQIEYKIRRRLLDAERHGHATVLEAIKKKKLRHLKKPKPQPDSRLD